MEYWGPWSTFYSKSGGTISGNVVITGTLGVNGLTTLNEVVIDGLAKINNQLLIIWDDVIGANPHLRLQDESAVGNVNVVSFMNQVGAVKGAIYGVDGDTVCIAPNAGGIVEVPSDVLGADPTWKIPNVAQDLTVRRMLMLHSIMFG